MYVMYIFIDVDESLFLIFIVGHGFGGHIIIYLIIYLHIANIILYTSYCELVLCLSLLYTKANPL